MELERGGVVCGNFRRFLFDQMLFGCQVHTVYNTVCAVYFLSLLIMIYSVGFGCGGICHKHGTYIQSIGSRLAWSTVLTVPGGTVFLEGLFFYFCFFISISIFLDLAKGTVNSDSVVEDDGMLRVIRVIIYHSIIG